MTCSHVEQVFGIPLGGRKLVLDTHFHRGGCFPSIEEIEHLMVETKNVEEFWLFFIIFTCARLLIVTMHFKGHHALWHASPEALTRDVNWGQFLLDELMHKVHDYRHNRGSYIRGCLLFLQVLPS